MAKIKITLSKSFQANAIFRFTYVLDQSLTWNAINPKRGILCKNMIFSRIICIFQDCKNCNIRLSFFHVFQKQWEPCNMNWVTPELIERTILECFPFQCYFCSKLAGNCTKTMRVASLMLP